MFESAVWRRFVSQRRPWVELRDASERAVFSEASAKTTGVPGGSACLGRFDFLARHQRTNGAVCDNHITFSQLQIING